MAITNIENSPGGGGGGSGQLMSAKVGKIILDGSTEFAAQYGGYDAVGTIFYTRPNNTAKTDSSNAAFDELNIDERFEGTARPLFPWMKYYPLINEIVLIISSTSRNEIGGKTDPQAYYLPSINIWNHPHHNNYPAVQNYQEEEDKPAKYANAGIMRRETDSTKEIDIPLGAYFVEQLGIKPLQPYEGDLIVEGRFGNSIRLGATAKSTIITSSQENNWSYGGGPNGDPITIIRNGQSDELDDQGWVHTVEDINRDPSSIYLTSNQLIQEFIPSSLNWRSYKAVVAPNDQEEVQAMVTSPVDFVQEEIVEPPVECPEGQHFDEELQACVPDDEEVTGQLNDEDLTVEEEKVDVIVTTDEDGNTVTTPNPETIAEIERQKEALENGEEEEEEYESLGEGDDLFDELTENFDDDELTIYQNDAISGDSPSTGQFKEMLQNERGTAPSATSKPGGGGGSAGSTNKGKNTNFSSAAGHHTQKKPNGYPCTVHAKKHKNSQFLKKPLTLAQMISNIASDPKSNRVEYLCCHTTAGYLKHTFIDLAHLFLQSKPWSRSGYHILFQADGKCIRALPDSINSNGVGNGAGGITNSNSINISWIGGADEMDMTKEQALAYNKVLKAYVKKYPNIKIMGHNQLKAKACPRWNVPKHLELLGIPEKNIERFNFRGGSNPDANIGGSYLTHASWVANPSKYLKSNTIDFSYINNVKNTISETNTNA
tara:strand:- start:10238 stop:12379 length:2142 start_codon:yes stop_codon:yes gene_type:complete